MAAQRRRPRKAVGPDRPGYLGGQDVDKVMAVVLALMSEVATLRERIDTHERLADQGDLPSPAAVERFCADDVVEGEREAWRDGFIRRLLRVVTEEVEAASRLAGKESDA